MIRYLLDTDLRIVYLKAVETKVRDRLARIFHRASRSMISGLWQNRALIEPERQTEVAADVTCG